MLLTKGSKSSIKRAVARAVLTRIPLFLTTTTTCCVGFSFSSSFSLSLASSFYTSVQTQHSFTNRRSNAIITNSEIPRYRFYSSSSSSLLKNSLISSSENNMESEKKKINYADDAGLTSDLGLSYTPDGVVAADNNDDNTEEAADATTKSKKKSVGEICIEELGKPSHISTWPTGTMEFVNESTEGCCDAVKATLSALQTRMSTHPPKILILYGSVGEESKSKKLAIEAGRILSNYGSSVKVYDPIGLPIFSLDLNAEDVSKAKELRELVMWCEAMVWVSPEIHGNMSACFKNQIDWIPLSTGAIRPTQGKTVSVMQVEAGSQSFNTVNNMRVLARWMRMICTPNQSSIPKAYMEFDSETGEMKQSSLRDRVVDVMDELFKYTILLRDQQPYLLQRYSEQQKQQQS